MDMQFEAGELRHMLFTHVCDHEFEQDADLINDLDHEMMNRNGGLGACGVDHLD